MNQSREVPKRKIEEYKKAENQNFCLSTELSLLEQEEHSLNQYVEVAKARYDKTKCPGVFRGFSYDRNREWLPWERRVQKRDRFGEHKKAAEKYGGAVSIETQENTFILHVLLIIPQHP